MSALALAMRCTPTASATERVAGMPSGTRATMTPRANKQAIDHPELEDEQGDEEQQDAADQRDDRDGARHLVDLAHQW